MVQLNLPPFTPKLRRTEGKLYIYDLLRQKYVRLTPEEWVRQHFVNYLLQDLGYPRDLMMNEVMLELYGLTKRADTILYSRKLEPQVLMEYKAPSVRLNQNVLNQIVRYNYTLRVPYLLLSNGLEHLAYQIHYDTMSFTPLTYIPSYQELLSNN